MNLPAVPSRTFAMVRVPPFLNLFAGLRYAISMPTKPLPDGVMVAQQTLNLFV